MNNGFKVEYSDDDKQICIIPHPFIPFHDFDAIVSAFIKLGYKY